MASRIETISEKVNWHSSVIKLALAAVLWSSGALLLKWVEWNSLAIAGARSAIAALTVYALTPHLSWRFSRIQWAGALAYMATVGLLLIEPILNPIWVMVFLGERPGKWSLIGGAIVLAAASLRGVQTARQTNTFGKRQRAY